MKERTLPLSFHVYLHPKIASMLFTQEVHDHAPVPEEAKGSMRKAVILLAAFQVFLLILLGTCTGQDPLEGEVFTQAYNMFIGVEIMMFIGFGYLMVRIK